MRKNAPLLAGLTAFLMLVFGILELIQAIRGLNSISGGNNEIASYARGAIVFELIMSIIIILSSLISLTMALKNAEAKSLYYSTGVVLTLFTLGSIIDTFIAYGLLRKILGDYASFPGSSIAKLVFLFIALLLLIIGLFMLRSYLYDSKGGGVLAGASVSLLVVCIISFTVMNSDTDGITIASTIIFLLATILSCAEYINSYGYDDYSYSSTNSTQYKYDASTDTFIETKPSVSDNDASEQLRKLKKLFDDGIITAEEYEEKRKKYVDKL